MCIRDRVYIVGTNSEKVAAEGVGPGADLYEAFFDRGLLYGSLEKWGSTDIHLSTNGVSGFPVRENTQGGGVQLQYGPFYADVAYRNRQGEMCIRDRYQRKPSVLKSVPSNDISLFATNAEPSAVIVIVRPTL